MEHYLMQSLTASKDAHLLSDLKLSFQGEHCQIDHLVMHQHGMIIIETKSLSGQIFVNGKGDCYRITRSGWKMRLKSPIKQARRQRGILLQLLDYNHESLGLSRRLDQIPAQDLDKRFKLIGAVPNSTVIKAVDCTDTSIFRFSEAASEVEQILAQKETRISKSRKLKRVFKPDQLQTISDLLLRTDQASPHQSKHHYPRMLSCLECGSDSVQTRYGCHGSYLKCGRCFAIVSLEGESATVANVA